MVEEDLIDVSIIIPTYNRLWSLPRTIDSCRSTICNVEIIVVDDGSTDGTLDWLKEKEEIRYVWQENQGKCVAVNKGYELAKGKYVRFLDSDDMLLATSIDEQFKLAETREADIVVSGYCLIDENDKVLKTQDWIHCDDFISQQLGECDSSHYSAYLFRKKFLKSIYHRSCFAYRDDRMFVLEAALKEPRVTVHCGHALMHRHHSNNRLQFTTGRDHSAQNLQHFEIYKITLQHLAVSNKLNQRRKNAAINVLWPLAKWTSKYSVREGLEIWDWIKRLDPNFHPVESGALNYVYRHFGFKYTQYLLKLRRRLKYI